MDNLFHLHVTECHSTQELLKEQTTHYGVQHPAMISTSKQTGGKGRRGNTWQAFDNSFAASFTWPRRDNITMVPLEIGVLVCYFIKAQCGEDIRLKWPNDLLNSKNEKVGGILMYLHEDKLFVGLGMNFKGSDKKADFDFPMGFIQTDSKIDENFYLAFYEFILSKNRLPDNELRDVWYSFCSHRGVNVTIVDEDKSFSGEFIGISSLGEAIIKDGDEERTFISGTLRFSDHE
jgi:BirA family biotin operon repressor/biotin-[acetyl-CoA-carboxylase] ligase